MNEECSVNVNGPPTPAATGSQHCSPPSREEEVEVTPKPAAKRRRSKQIAHRELSARTSRMPEQSSDYRVAVFGAGGVGKSSIIQRFMNGTFGESYVPTIEDTYRKVISCNYKKNVCTLHITDTAGSHQFPAMMRLSISKGHAFILVYSVASKQSLEELGPIIKMMKETKGESILDTPIMLVGNKSDDSNRQVSPELGQKLATGWQCGFIETSAKKNENVLELFEELTKREKKRQLTLKLEDTSTKAKKRCIIS